ncbi:unnamed protein product, partial [Timema podura]|nr:unnamed protein product [Timema podura]
MLKAPLFGAAISGEVDYPDQRQHHFSVVVCVRPPNLSQELKGLGCEINNGMLAEGKDGYCILCLDFKDASDIYMSTSIKFPSTDSTLPVRAEHRDRKERKHYIDDWALGDEEIEGRRSFHLDEKIETDRFPQCFVKEMQGIDFNLAYLQKHGFNMPLLFRDKAGLGLRVPSSNFSVNDVRMCVGYFWGLLEDLLCSGRGLQYGETCFQEIVEFVESRVVSLLECDVSIQKSSRRVLDVMDVNTQKNVEMTMKEWQKYYEDTNKDKLLNVISLEFSHTKLEYYVQTPTVFGILQVQVTAQIQELYTKQAALRVRQIDWVDCVWPKHLKESQTESTNVIDEMMYPKIFWLIPPTERNLQLYEHWVLSGKQADVFFGDTVEKCGRVTLTSGNTFFIPTGWIHAVYTPLDSLVFGGNFLHSFGIDKQLKTAQVEDTTHVPQKFRYPFFTEMLWYVLERYVHCLLGRSHLDEGGGGEPEPVKSGSNKHTHLTPQ